MAVTSIDFYKFLTGPDVLLSVLIIISGLVIYLFAFAFVFLFWTGSEIFSYSEKVVRDMAI